MEENKPAKPWWQEHLALFYRLSAWIGTPVIIGLIIGKWLDNKYNTHPWLLLAVLGFCFVVSIFGLVKNTISEYQKLNKKETSKEK